jgi:hypothetical protein
VARQQQEGKAAALAFVEQSLVRMQLQLQHIESSLVLGSKQQSSGLRRPQLQSDGGWSSALELCCGLRGAGGPRLPCCVPGLRWGPAEGHLALGRCNTS